MKLNPNQLEGDAAKYVMQAEPMTVKELIEKLNKMPKKAKVYMVFDKMSEGAWDEDLARWRYAVPLVNVNKEVNYGDDDRWDKETNVLLEVEDY